MASSEAITRRAAAAAKRLETATAKVAEIYGIEDVPIGAVRASQAALGRVLTMERAADFLENLLAKVAPAGGDDSGLAATMLTGNVGEIKAHVEKVTSVAALQSLLDAEAEGKGRAGVTTAIEKRIAELEAEAAEADESTEEETDE